MNKSGATLIELMVATGILMVGIAGVSQLYSAQVRMSEASIRRLEVVSLQKEVYNLLSSELNCLRNFINVDPTVAAGITDIFDSSGAARVSTGEIYPRAFTITQIRRIPSTPALGAPYVRFDVVIDITMNDVSNTQTQTRVPVFTQVDAGNRVVSCASVGSSRTDCQYVSNSGSGAVTVTCPANYRVIGGGNQDSDVDKEGAYQSEPIAANPPLSWGGYRCRGESGGNRRCWAVCCR